MSAPLEAGEDYDDAEHIRIGSASFRSSVVTTSPSRTEPAAAGTGTGTGTGTRAQYYRPPSSTSTARSHLSKQGHQAFVMDEENQRDSDERRSRRQRGQSEIYNESYTDLCTLPIKVASCCGVFLFVVILAIVMIVDSVHVIDEGTVGIYFVQGALDDKVTQPGVHWMLPFITEYEEVTIRPQTDTLKPINTVTKDGIENSFRGIQVLSDVDQTLLVALIRKFGMNFRQALVYDRVSEELRTFCANSTIDEVYNTKFLTIVGEVRKNVVQSIARLGMSGIKILNLVIPKPEIPVDIARNYRQVKVQWTEQLVATQQQRTETIKKETETILALADAEREKKVLQIDIQKDVLRKEGEKNLSELQNSIVKNREQTVADVGNYAKKKEAEANSILYTDQFVKLELARSLSNNTKFFFSGQESMLGSLFNSILNR